MDATIALLIGKKDKTILSHYLEQVANKSLLAYRNASHLQWGKKQGESLYTHILNGIFILDSLRDILQLPDSEVKILFTAYTVHDINKFEEQQGSFNSLATQENIASEIERLNLPQFFLEWGDYLADIEGLVRSHGRSTHTSGELLIPNLGPRYRLGRERILALRYLMKATDTLDLSHSLDERKHKGDFLDDFNTYLSESETAAQYEFITHRLTESRGLLSNVLHNAIAAHLQNQHDLVPLLFYPDGIAYLAKRGQIPTLTNADQKAAAQKAAKIIKGFSQSKFRDFIKPGNQGIKVDKACLDMGIPFAGSSSIWGEIYNIVQRKSWNTDSLEAKARERAERDFEKYAALYPETAVTIRTTLDNLAPLIDPADIYLRKGELVRSYYIFLNKYFKKSFDDVWTHLYELLEIVEEERPFFAYFDANYDRSYILGSRLTLDEETIVERIAADGTEVLSGEDKSDPNIPLLQAYLEHYCIFSVGGQTAIDFQANLQQYVTAQHKQCINCSSPFPTNEWMSGDVRGDITVQVFSNRRRGGTGAPKKNICAMCQLQFLLEKLNYPAVRNEQLRYLHLFPYSFLTRPFIEALRTTFHELIENNDAITALNLDSPQALAQWIEETEQTPTFRTETKKGKPQPYGIYVPRYSDLVGNLLIFPLNPAGNNDTQKFLFALWNGMVIQRHFGMKALLSASPVPPLEKENFGDLYVDNIPLGTQGLLPENNYHQFKPGADGRVEDTLPILWQKTAHLQRLRELTFTSDDNTPRLIRALTAHPLMIYFETDRLLIAKAGSDAGGLETWLYQQAFEPVHQLAHLTKGDFMQKLSRELKKAATIAVQHNLRGSSFERSSLLYPFNEVMQKLAQDQGRTAVDRETLRAAATQDIYDHLDRLATRAGYKMTKKRAEACSAFVNCWFDDILAVYNGQTRKLIADEKLLRSAFLFYVRQQQAVAKEARS
ncbi:MAG: type I-D CRISPR-associated protein Cas10d/Csc3 [Anaerolineales bacterium]|nr:type I-D CRISPR-associated protein Cas10d/Csc3 [Anaerolineales bacterium]